MRVVKSSYHQLLWMQIIIAFFYSVAQASSATLTNKNLPKIMEAITALPKKYQPFDMKQSLTYMLEGGQIWKAICQSKWYNALFLSNISIDDARIVQLALNGSDDTFWLRIHNDTKVQTAIEHCNIPFTRDTSMMPAYKMLFRITYIRSRLESHEALQQIQASYQHAIVALQWFLYAQAILQNNSESLGVISIPDAQLLLFYFLDGYAELMSPRYRFYSSVHPHSLWQPSAYARPSNYWPYKKTFNDTMFGIDFYDKDHHPLMILPYHNSHLMFCALDNGMTSIIWEPYGVTLNVKNKTFTALRHPFKYFHSKKSEVALRKDKIPHDVMLQFKSLLGHNLGKKEIDLISKDGISAMLGMLSMNAQKLFIEFLTKHKKYGTATIFMRKGDEIILQPSLFKKLSGI